jgi:hypothetical protein
VCGVWCVNQRGMVQVTDEGLSQAGRWPDLTTLDLWENMRLTDRTLLAASSCGKLETVRLCGRAFTDSGMRSLASGCPGTVADHAFSFSLVTYSRSLAFRRFCVVSFLSCRSIIRRLLAPSSPPLSCPSSFFSRCAHVDDGQRPPRQA